MPHRTLCLLHMRGTGSYGDSNSHQSERWLCDHSCLLHQMLRPRRDGRNGCRCISDAEQSACEEQGVRRLQCWCCRSCLRNLRTSSNSTLNSFALSTYPVFSALMSVLMDASTPLCGARATSVELFCAMSYILPLPLPSCPFPCFV